MKSYCVYLYALSLRSQGAEEMVIVCRGHIPEIDVSAPESPRRFSHAPPAIGEVGRLLQKLRQAPRGFQLELPLSTTT